MPDYKKDMDALEEGEGELWMVRVVSSADDCDWVDLQTRAPTMEEAAAKAEAHARLYPEMYFDLRQPTFDAIRHDIYRVEEEGEA